MIICTDKSIRPVAVHSVKGLGPLTVHTVKSIGSIGPLTVCTATGPIP